MKKVGKILSLVTIFVMLTASFCFAAPEENEDGTDGSGTLVLKETYPKDGATGTAVENVGVKLYFDSEFTAENLKTENSAAVTLCDEEGNVLPTRVLYSTRESGVVLVLFDETKKTEDTAIKQNATYIMKISADFRDDAGNTLGEEHSITFKTLNQSASMMVNTLMMFGMFGGMMVLSARSAKKQAEQQKKEKEEKVNPYKEAKRTGKSVEEIVEKDQREKAKRAAKAAKKAAAAADEDSDDADYDDGKYHVKAPRPISAAGGRYVSGRKAIAEAKKAEEERRKAQQAKKGKGKKKK